MTDQDSQPHTLIAGDVVEFKLSPGKTMTVESITEGASNTLIQCVWFNLDGNGPFRGSYDARILRRVSRPPRATAAAEGSAYAPDPVASPLTSYQPEDLPMPDAHDHHHNHAEPTPVYHQHDHTPAVHHVDSAPHDYTSPAPDPTPTPDPSPSFDGGGGGDFGGGGGGGDW